MSSSLERSLGPNYENLNKVLEPYVEDLLDSSKHLNLNGKGYKEANKEQAQWVSYYDERRLEIKTILEYFDIEVERVRTKIIRGFERYHRDLTDSMKKVYANNEPELLEVQKRRLTVQEIYGKYNSLVEAFKQRGYSLKNIATLIQANIEDTIL